MNLLARFRCAARSFFYPSATAADLEEELRSHIAHRTDDLERSGLPRAEAERRASIEFGGYQHYREESHEALGGNFLRTVLQDLRFAARMMRKSPAFTVIVVLTLALGIGANTAIFTLVDAVLLRSIPVKDPEQLVVLQWQAHAWPHNIGTTIYGDCGVLHQHDGSEFSSCSFPWQLYQEIESHAAAFSSVMAFAGPAKLDLSGNGAARIAEGELVSGSYFHTLGVRAALGRTLQPRDDQPGAAPVVVLNYGYWKSAFAGAPSAIGKTIRLNGVLCTIVGVADPSFTRLTPGKSVNLWVPLSAPLKAWFQYRTGPTQWWLAIVGRLAPSVSRRQAQSQLNALFLHSLPSGGKTMWSTSDDPHLLLLPAQQGLLGFRAKFQQPLLLLLAAVGLVLLIACANVAGLLLARSAAREKEMAVRLAMGAARRRLMRQLLTESLMLSFAGAVLGILVAWVAVKGLTAFFYANAYSSMRLDLHPDLRMLAFTIGVALLTGIGFGLAPASRAARASVATELKGGSAAVTRGARRFGLGNGLVVLQVALAMVVLTGAGLLIRTLNKLRSVDAGFDTHSLLLFSIDPTLAGYHGDRIRSLYDTLQQRLAALPGVEQASYSSFALLDSGWSSGGFRIEGPDQKESVNLDMLLVGDGFFRTMKIPLLLGRVFRLGDERAANRVALVNQAFVRQYLHGRNPLGVHLDDSGKGGPRYEIIGVVRDTKYVNLRDQDPPIAYFPQKDFGATFVLRTAAAPAALLPAVRKTVASIDNNLPLLRVETQSQTIDRLLFNERLVTRLFSLFGLLGLALAAIGLYGLLSYEVARRTREIGIRTALGAQRGDVLAMILRQGLALVAVGAALGSAAAAGAGRLLGGLLWGVRAADPPTLFGVAAILVFVGAFACLIPARRATQIDPMESLRQE